MENAFGAWTQQFNNAAGFHIRFDNGYKVSVVWDDPGGMRYGNGKEHAEVGIFYNGRNIDVQGWQTTTDLLTILNEVAAR